MDKNEISKALSGLDPRVEAHWTKAGIPALDHLESVLGYGVTRSNLKEMGFAEIDRETAPIPDEVVVSGASIESLQHAEQAFKDLEAPDAIKLIESFCAAVQTDRFRRNSHLQALARQWQVQQHGALEHQKRIDKRIGVGEFAQGE